MRDWIYLVNPFLAVADRSYLSAVVISTFHDNALSAGKANAFIQGLYNRYHPLHEALKTNYDNWKTQGGTQQGESLNLKQLLQLLTQSKIQQWDIKIQNVYAQNSSQYKKLLPSRRIPFQTGSQIERIRAVQGLSLAIGSDSALADVKADVDSFYVQLDETFNTQKSSISTTKTHGNTLEVACAAMAQGQYANLGALIQEYAATPEKIEVFFDLKTIRTSQQISFTGHVKPGSIDTLLKHTFAASDQIYLKNSGNITLQFYLAATKGQRPSTKVFSLAPGEQTVAIGELGDIANSFVTVYNPDTFTVGAYEVELL